MNCAKPLSATASSWLVLIKRCGLKRAIYNLAANLDMEPAIAIWNEAWMQLRAEILSYPYY